MGLNILGVGRMQTIPYNTPLSYTHLDSILDKMLAEVDKQEKLVDDETEFKPSCVNTVNINPTEEALIELPLAIKKEKRHINTYEFGSHVPEMNVVNPFADTFVELPIPNSPKVKRKLVSKITEPTKMVKRDICVNTFNLDPSEDTFIELPFPTTKTKNSHMNTYDFGDLQTEPIDLVVDDNYLELGNDVIPFEIEDIFMDESQNLESAMEPPEIWYEGTYRQLSLVPEEDENITPDIDPKNYVYQIPYQPPIKVKESYDTLSQCSSSDEKTTEDESTDSDSQVVHVKPIKPEVKLMVKTIDGGREEIEVHSLHDVLEHYKSAEKLDDNKSNIKYNRSLSNTLPRSNVGKIITKKTDDDDKPSFTLQRLFVRSPGCEPSFICKGNLITSKEISKSQPELVAASNIKYPLQYDNTQIDLHANMPFYPCYNQTNPLDSYNRTYTQTYDTDSFPSAYCDWLLPTDHENQEGNVKKGLI